MSVITRADSFLDGIDTGDGDLWHIPYDPDLGYALCGHRWRRPGVVIPADEVSPEQDCPECLRIAEEMES